MIGAAILLVAQASPLLPASGARPVSAVLPVARPPAVPLALPGAMTGSLACGGIRYDLGVRTNGPDLGRPAAARLLYLRANGTSLVRADASKLAGALHVMVGVNFFVEHCDGRRAVLRYGIVEPGTGKPVRLPAGVPGMLDVVLDGPRLATLTLRRPA